MLVEALVLALGQLSAAVAESQAPPGMDAEQPPAYSASRDADLPALGSGPRWRAYAGAAVGRGLRFNNPYRLQTQLGSSAESLSLSATYVDLFAGVAAGPSGSLQHGAVLHASVATDGVGQQVVTPCYALLVQPSDRWWVGGRVGLPVVVQPDANLGLEAGATVAVFVSAGVAVTAELVGALFYGAATLDTPRTTIPVVALQLGALFDYEVMP